MAGQAPQGSSFKDIDFAGPQPGKGTSAAHDPDSSGNGGQRYVLENEVLAFTWQLNGGKFAPHSVNDKITNRTFNQQGAELFRLTTEAPAPADSSFRVEIELGDASLIVRASRGNRVCQEPLASFPRNKFPDDPVLVRVGKMNLQAEAKDYGGEAGDMGEGRVFDITPAPAGKSEFAFRSHAHRAVVSEFPWMHQDGTQVLSARIDKGTDAGMSWAPAVALVWEEAKRFILVGVREKSGVFNVTTQDGERILSPNLTPFPAGDLPSSSFSVAGWVCRQPLPDGQALEVKLESPRGVSALWRAELKDGAHYVRHSVTFGLSGGADAKPLDLHGLELIDLRAPGLRTVGTVPGSPLAGDGIFAGVEMPGSANLVSRSGARSAFAASLVLDRGQSYSFGAVTGLAPGGQLRRSFLRCIERERARRSSPFLHYNCWYDLGFDVDEQKMVEVVNAFHKEMETKRGVPVLSYLIDDGWDDPSKALWREHEAKFPQGFKGTRAKVAQQGGNLSIWISPLGGYGVEQERTMQAQKMGLIPEGGKLDLSHPKYKQWFTDRCLQLMREGGVNAFKWDKAGEGVSPHFMALLDVAKRLRQENPAVFINVTVGTWPSPFWLNHIDTTWRSGSGDVAWAGKGDNRERWLTFRDGECLRLFVHAAPLYPLNSAMHHGIVHGRCFQAETVSKAGCDLKHEARSYFANGASLQELYLTPSMMTPDAWDHVASAAKWAHAHADVLRDAHWVGGDPLKSEPYGIAAWSNDKATLMLRNPDDVARTIEIEAAEVFDLPPAASACGAAFDLRTPYPDQRVRTLRVECGARVRVELEPFEVLVFDTDSAL